MPSQADSHFFRTVEDDRGTSWRVGVHARDGLDYKGRYLFVAAPDERPEAEAVALEDLRWNSEATARRTIETMSAVELRRRLREVEGRRSV